MTSPKLFAPETFWRIPPAERERLYKGCGPGNLGDKLVPDTMWGLSVKQACRIHDHCYEVGETEEDRQEADDVLLNNCLRLITAAGGPPLLMRLRRRRAWTYYCAVRKFGGPSFWNSKNRPEEFRAA